MRELPHRRKMYILAGVLLAMLLGALDATIVGPAMPNIVRDLGGMALLAWVFTIYSLTSTITIPIVGKLSDLYGRKWFYIGGISLFLVGSALSGAAGEPIFNSLFAPLGESQRDAAAHHLPRHPGRRRRHDDGERHGDHRRPVRAARARPLPGAHGRASSGSRRFSARRWAAG